MKRFVWLLSLLALAALPSVAGEDQKDVTKLLNKATQVLQEALGTAAAMPSQPATQPGTQPTDPHHPTPQQQPLPQEPTPQPTPQQTPEQPDMTQPSGAGTIPSEQLAQAKCIAVFPGVETGAVGIGFSSGDGVLTCRTGENYDGDWSAPAIINLEDVSFGAQIGGKESDMIVVVTSNEASKNILDDDFKFSADASAVASTERAETQDSDRDDFNEGVRVYSRTEGVFAGAAITGGKLDADDDANEALYGREIKARDILSGNQVTPPAEAQQFLSTLKQHTMKHDTMKDASQPNVPPKR